MLTQIINLYLGNKAQLIEDKWTACLYSKSVKMQLPNTNSVPIVQIQCSSTSIDG